MLNLMIAPITLAALAAATFTSSAVAQTYTYDDGTTENAINYDNIAEIGFMHGFDSGAAGDSIQAISVAIGTALAPVGGLDGRMTRVAIWDDPTNDGDPIDAVLLFASASFPATMTNSDQKVAIPLPVAVAVTGTFYIGALVETVAGEFPVGLDQTSPTAGALTFAFGDATAIDPANPNGGTIGLGAISGAVFLLDATGGGTDFLSTNYCMANANSSGLPGTMSGIGSTVAANNNVTLIASDLPANQFGFFVCSRTQGFVPFAGGSSNGNLCLGGIIGRLSMQNQIVNSGANGEFSLALDLTSLPEGGTTASVMAGDIWNFQAWFRDPVGQGSNFTDGIEVAFQ